MRYKNAVRNVRQSKIQLPFFNLGKSVVIVLFYSIFVCSGNVARKVRQSKRHLPLHQSWKIVCGLLIKNCAVVFFLNSKQSLFYYCGLN
jgi:hypothetical protein